MCHLINAAMSSLAAYQGKPIESMRALTTEKLVKRNFYLAKKPSGARCKVQLLPTFAFPGSMYGQRSLISCVYNIIKIYCTLCTLVGNPPNQRHFFGAKRWVQRQMGSLWSCTLCDAIWCQSLTHASKVSDALYCHNAVTLRLNAMEKGCLTQFCTLKFD